MNELERARLDINQADEQIAKYFQMRMRASKDIAKYKKKYQLPIYDPAREKQVIEKNLGYIDGEELKSYYVLFQQHVMDVSKMYQQSVMEGVRAAYSGVEGAYAHIAARKIFPGAKHIPCPNFEEAYRSVENGQCDCAVLPIENSTAGEVGSNMDMIYGGSLYISGMYDLKISHNLLAKPKTALSDIKTVVSHYQAIEQCADYINKYGFQVQRVVNTAVAAKMVSESDEKDIAAIASRETAQLYGLDIIAENINQSDCNTTRFAVLTRVDTTARDSKYFTLGFSVKHEAGALSRAIDVIGKHGFNMISIKSRALKNALWQYYFFIEAQGNINSPQGKKMEEEISLYCSDFRVLGAYGDHVQLEN